MRKLVPLLLLIIVLASYSTSFSTEPATRPAQTFYVSSAGADSNNGTSAQTAWQTLAKVNVWTFVPGDTLRFRGGDTFNGMLTNATLTGAPGATVTVNSYGNGNATLNGGNGDCIHLVNPEFLTLEGLAVMGSGWTGAGASINATNGGKGIWIENTRTSGGRLRNITISHCRVSGFYMGVMLDTTRVNSTGFENARVAANVVKNDLTIGINLEGYHPYLEGPVDQSRGVYVGYNIVQNIPGDPYSGAGGIHGTFKTEAGGIQVANTTGGTVERNLLTDIAGYGGLKTGLTYGGSTAIVVTNGRGYRVTANEIARTGCVARYDGSAIDVDQDGQDVEINGNLTYNNMGPAVQIGSFGGKVSSNIRIHHNISYNDARGNNSGGISEQGAIRIWGNTDELEIFNNTIYLDAAGTLGAPSAVNFEQVPIGPADLGTNAHIQFVNNIFKMVGGVPVFRANQKTNPTHLRVAAALGNLYDTSGGKLVIGDDNGSSITTLAEWRKAGFESLDGVDYGTLADAGLQNVAAFAPPAAGFIETGVAPSAIHNFDLKTNSAAVGTGVDPWSAKVLIDLGAAGYHGTPSRTGVGVDAGACPYEGQ